MQSNLELVLSIIEEEASMAGSPTTGPLAGAIWQISNRIGDANLAKQFMHNCGYKAFVGWPLQRQRRAKDGNES